LVPVDIERLIRLKIDVMLHDPPHKSFLIKTGEDFKTLHEKIAKFFRERVLEGTRFKGVSVDEKLVRLCDAIASTIERKMIMYAGWPRGIYLSYSKLHNVFDPEINTPLTPPPDLMERAENAAIELNNLLTKLDVTGTDDVLLYNALYIALEASWYSHGLPPSLADTRMPTHSIFDHVYAATTIANIVRPADSSGEVVEGYYVVADFPSVQRFVGAGRKAGDFWASSWLLSNVVWGVAKNFAFRYGLDILVSPTPRLNPYAVKSLEEELVKALEGRVSSLEDICRETKYSRTCRLLIQLKKMTIWPIIPATLSMVLPKQGLSSVDSVATEIAKAYADSWRSMVESVMNSLSKSRDYAATLILYKKLDELKNIVDMPPQGLRIFVVDIGRVYEAVQKCLNNDLDKCLELGIRIESGLEEFDRRLKDIVCSGRERCREFDSAKKDVALTLLWHLLYTKTPVLAKHFGIAKAPTPRPFWVYEDNSLKPLADFVGGWIPCVVCGSEPAVIKFAKKPGREGEVTFDLERSEGLPKDFDLKYAEQNLNVLEKVFKPGEALGPYCLLKRAVYFAKHREIEFESTDDVALSWISHVVNVASSEFGNLFSFEKAAEKISAFEDLKGVPEHSIANMLKGLLMPGEGKDIELAAKSLGVGFERFVKMLTDALLKTCVEAGQKSRDFVVYLLNHVRALGLEVEDVRELWNFVLDKLAGSRSSNESYRAPEISKLCKTLSLPTTFAIVRCDADNIGAIHRGEKPKSLEEYGKSLASVLKNVYEEALPAHKAEDIINKVSSLLNLFKYLSINEVPVTPARTSALSTSLMLQALEDSIVVKRGFGVLIYSGGDDVLALTPPQTALRVSLELRQRFDSDTVEIILGEDLVKIPKMHIPTGRSASIRFVNLKDLMNLEFGKAHELLENIAKKAKWRTHRGIQAKDVLVVSDSRSGARAILPLGIALDETVATLALTLLTAMGIISSGLPEDFRSKIRDMDRLPDKALRKIFEYVLKKNTITLKDVKLGEEILNRLSRWLDSIQGIGISVEEGIGETSLFENVANLISITRRHI